MGDDDVQKESIAVRLARKFVERATTIGLKGKARDNAALEYASGALALAEICADGITDPSAKPDLENLRMLVYMTSLRGYEFLVTLAKDKQP